LSYDHIVGDRTFCVGENINELDAIPGEALESRNAASRLALARSEFGVVLAT
jgi:hypothetical protein